MNENKNFIHATKINKMIDKITLLNNNISDEEKLQIINTNNLQYSFIQGSEVWDNSKVKNLTGGILVKITNKRIKVEGSIHKYFHFLNNGTLENYTPFSMVDFQYAIKKLIENYGLKNIDFLVKTFEIGLNVYTDDIEPKDILKRVISIGNINGIQRKIYINPKYKNETFLTTQMSKDNVLVYRIYDKNFERTDKGKKNKIPNCVRIETLRTKRKDLTLSQFCEPLELMKLQNSFLLEWSYLNFDKEIKAPKGTHQSKKDLAKNILLHGKNEVLKSLYEKRGQITEKIFRTSKEFINNWETNKFNYSFIPSEITPKWAIFYNSAIQLVIKYPHEN